MTNSIKQTMEMQSAANRMALRKDPDLVELHEGEFVDYEAYYEATRLGFPESPWDDELDDYDETIIHDSLYQYMVAEDHFTFLGVPDGTYKVMAFHSYERKIYADNAVGFTMTEFVADKGIMDSYVISMCADGRSKRMVNLWGRSVSHIEVVVKNGKASHDLAKAVVDAHARSGYWGDYYEGVEFNKELNAFTIGVGS